LADRDKNIATPDDISQDNSRKLLDTDRSGTPDERGDKIEDLI
jgi:hypothetical protein|tara:strand:+ start:855 stop:983 length:129 start_codon:yes stop_codon:yes gene_type:complete